ncbi:MAG: CheR family methyltransferase, partial [Pirellulaceae bacterium]
NHCGVDFSDYKTTTISRRIQRRIMLTGISDLETYARMLINDADEVERLYKDLLIGVTSFFRDGDVFGRIERDVLPQLMGRLDDAEEFRAWVVGTATGEEAYSIAILLSEYLTSVGKSRPIKVFASDVHRESLYAASRGIYPSESLAGVSPERVARCFVRQADGFHIIPELRRMVVFVTHNVAKDAPFTKLDLITCRNVMIYLTPQAQRRVLSLFHFAMKRDAVLCLGPSESTGELSEEFETIDERARIFRKRRDMPLPANMRLPVSVPAVSMPPAAPPAPLLSYVVPARELLSTYDWLLETFMPPGLLIGPKRELLHAFSGASRYMQLRDGRPSTDVLDLVHPDVRPHLSSALRRLERDGKPVVYAGIRLHGPEGQEALNLVVRNSTNPACGHRILVTFESQPALPQAPVDVVDARNHTSDEIDCLERELAQTRDSLQATIEELQATNEELQSANEQLVASNEELQSTNEELHSVNEELYTVNAEHQRKIDELTELTNDIDNLLNSTNVHTIFLDAELRIRRFTPGVGKAFNFISQDVGRRIDTFTYNIVDEDLLSEIRQVLEQGAPFEREVRDRHECWFLLRIWPYVAGNRIDGVVITLIDISSLKRVEKRLAEMSEIVEHSDDAILRIALDGTVTTWNRGAERLFGYPAEEIVGRNASLLCAEGDREAEDYLRRIAQGLSVDHVEAIRVCRDGHRIDVSLTMSPIRGEIGNVVGMSVIVRDITDRKRAAEEVLAAVRHRDQFLAMLSHELRNPLAAVLNATSLLKEENIGPDVDCEAREVIEHNVQHVARLLDDLLDVSRFTHDKISLHLEVVDLNSLTMDVVDCVQHMVDDKRQQLHVLLSEEPLYVEGDVGRLQQAQVNLLVNACKYTPEGGRIDYRLARDGEDAVITVRDDGEGISEALLQRIFEPFVQSEQTLDRSQGGMGLGLPLVRMIVEAHEGTIVARSEGNGHGSEFLVRLRLTSKRPQRPAEMRVIANTRRKLLIVEDNDGIRRMLARSMELKGFIVSAAGDGQQGLEKFIEFEPEIALIDVGLPDVNGFDLARIIRSKPAYRECLLVAVTGYGRESDREQALAAGFDLHLVKPLDPTELVVAITDWPTTRARATAVPTPN